MNYDGSDPKLHNGWSVLFLILLIAVAILFVKAWTLL